MNHQDHTLYSLTGDQPTATANPLCVGEPELAESQITIYEWGTTSTYPVQALRQPGTSAVTLAEFWYDAPATSSLSQAPDAHITRPDPEETRRAVSELRRMSGLTWDQLGRLFEVSRRTMHSWASGKRLNANNEERLWRVLDVVRTAYRGSAQRTRAALFQVREGESPFDLLLAQRFNEARSVLGPGPPQRPRPSGQLSAEAKAAREPVLRPWELFDAKHDRVHSESDVARAVRTVRNTPRGQS